MSPSTQRRLLLAWLAALGASGTGTRAALAQEAYPGKGPIKVIVPLPAGGAADVSVRLVTAALQAQMKQTIVIDNRPGGSFVIGMQVIAQAPADGYTLIHLNPSMTSAQATLKKIDLLKTLVPISVMGTVPSVLAVPSSSPFKSVRELVVTGAAKPGALGYGSVGMGSLQHLWCSNFSKRHGLDALHVPFKGAPEAATALVSGEIQFMPLNLTVALGLLQKGLIRALAVLDTQPHAAILNVPTLKDVGYEEPPLVFWGGLAAPRGTPAAIVEQLRENMATALATPEVKTKLMGMGITPMSSPSAPSFEAFVAQELAWMSEAVKNAKLQLD